MQSRMQVPSFVGQSFPNTLSYARLPIITSWIQGKRLLGCTKGSSPSRQLQCAPHGLKYLRDMILQFLCIFDKERSNISTHDLLSPYGLVGLCGSVQTQLSLSPYTPAVDENIKLQQSVYFYIALNKLIDPTTLFSQYSNGNQQLSPIAFLAAKCITPSIPSPFSLYNLKIPSKKFTSSMLPWWNLTRFSISDWLRTLERIVFILQRTSGKQLERSSMMTTLVSVCRTICTIVCEPIKPSPPGTSKFLTLLIIKEYRSYKSSKFNNNPFQLQKKL